MARNQEKAQSMMNRYLKGKQDEQAGPKKLRPFLASEVSDLQEADKWHHQVVREISRKVSEIQNAGLGEHRCRPAPGLLCRARSFGPQSGPACLGMHDANA